MPSSDPSTCCVGKWAPLLNPPNLKYLPTPLQRTVHGQCRAWRNHFMNIIGYRNLTEAKLARCVHVHFHWKRSYYSKTERRLQQNALSGPRVYITDWNIVRCSGLLGWSDFGSNVYKVWPRMQPINVRCEERVECLSFHVPPVVWCRVTAPHYVFRNYFLVDQCIFRQRAQY